MSKVSRACILLPVFGFFFPSVSPNCCTLPDYLTLTSLILLAISTDFGYTTLIKMIWRTYLGLVMTSASLVNSLPPYEIARATITLPPHSGHPANLSQLLKERLNDDTIMHLGKRQSGVIGTGICSSTMQGFICDPSHHEENRCAGDEYSYCICAGSASLPGRDPQGLWL